MKRALFVFAILAVLFPFAAVQAQGNRAVSETNGEGLLQYVEGGAVSASANINLPIADLFGLTVGARLGEDDDTDSYGYFAGLFTRDPTFGYVGAVVGYDNLNASNGPDADLTTWQVRGALYLSHADVFASWSHLDVDPGRLRNDDLGSVGLAWYMQPDVRLFAALGLDDAQDTYTAGFEVQPEVFNRRASLRFGYTDGKNSESIISAAFRYFFAEPKSLEKRLREDVFQDQ